MSQEIQNFFKENNYVVIQNFITPEMVALMHQYCRIKVQRENYKSTYKKSIYNESWDGSWGDVQAPQAYSSYGDPLMDGLLEMATPKINDYTGLSLLPQYTYWRFYQKGDVLERHRDRNSCEISVTLCLGYDVSNVDKHTYPDFDWPMFIEEKSGRELPIHMKPGDMIIYKGCEVDHWREKFIGNYHAQVFMHFNDSDGPYKQILDGRPILGIPKPE